MFTNPLSEDFAFDLTADGFIADYDVHMEHTDQEVIYLESHSGKVADLIDDGGIVSYSIYSSEQARAHGEYDHIGGIIDEGDREEFLALFK
ncbi:hypothetical protein ACVNSK_10385 [Corynebacterium propinquum]